jgi:hypothetical protein
LTYEIVLRNSEIQLTKEENQNKNTVSIRTYHFPIIAAPERLGQA